jgi:capsular polysaccharide biosynthesis protein
MIRLSDGVRDVRDVLFPTKTTTAAAVYFHRTVILPMISREAAERTQPPELGPIKLFVRRESTYRRLKNQSEIEGWFARRGYLAVDPGALPFEAQARLFARATYVAGAEGAALTNILFAASAVQLIMFANPVVAIEGFFQDLAKRCGIAFISVFGEVCADQPIARNSDFAVPIAKLDGIEV